MFDGPGPNPLAVAIVAVIAHEPTSTAQIRTAVRPEVPPTRAIECTHRHKQRERAHRVPVQPCSKKAQSISMATRLLCRADSEAARALRPGLGMRRSERCRPPNRTPAVNPAIKFNASRPCRRSALSRMPLPPVAQDRLRLGPVAPTARDGQRHGHGVREFSEHMTAPGAVPVRQG
jgi:hypothetical protein